jgi:hypothetical protein
MFTLAKCAKLEISTQGFFSDLINKIFPHDNIDAVVSYQTTFSTGSIN